jgi:hypothetical protein
MIPHHVRFFCTDGAIFVLPFLLAESSRVPLLISWPGKILPNTKVEEKVSHLDVSLLDHVLSMWLVVSRRCDLSSHHGTVFFCSYLRPFWIMPKLVNMIVLMDGAFDLSLNAMKPMWTLMKMSPLPNGER